MLTLFGKIEDKLKLPIDIWFFFLFLFSFPLTIRKVLFYFPIQGTFNEYTGIYMYMSDILLIFTIGLWILSILSHDNNVLSRCRKWISWGIHELSTALPGLIVLLSFISIGWAINKDIAIFRSIKFLEYFLLYLYIIHRFIPFILNVPRGTLQNNALKQANLSPCNAFHTFWQESVLGNLGKKYSKPAPCSSNVPRGTFELFTGWNILFSIFIFSGVFQSIIGIFQFITKKSIGLRFLFESTIASDMPGVAKVIFNGEPYVRAYGLMPHPNILGGFLVFSIILSILYFKMFDACPVGQKCSTWNIFSPYGVEHFKNTSNENVPRGTFSVLTGWNIIIFSYNFLIKKYLFNTKWLIKALISIQLIALLLTFSKSAILAIFLAYGYIKFKNRIVPRSPASPAGERSAHNDTLVNSSNQNVPRGTFKLIWQWLNKIISTLLTFWYKSILGNFGNKCSTWNILRFFLPSHLNRTKLLIGLILAIGLYFIFRQLDFYYFITQPINERLFLLNVPRGTFWHSWVLGSGIGQFIPAISHFSQNLLLPWQYQPIHNVYVLIYAELGMLGIILFIWFILTIWRLDSHNVPRGTFREFARWNISRICKVKNLENLKGGISDFEINCHPEQSQSLPAGGRSAQNDKEGDSCSILCNDCIVLSSIYFRAILLAFIFIMLLDHYFWDIQQGSLMFWMVLGIIASFNSIKNMTRADARKGHDRSG